MTDVRQVVVAGVKVGLFGLDAILKRVAGEEFASDEERAERLLYLVSESNYVSASRREDYKQALLRVYKRSMGEDVPDEASGPEIRVLGPGCPRCERLAAEVIEAMTELELDADFCHVTDLAAIARFGPVATPALVIDGKVVFSGRVPSRAELIKCLKEVRK